MGNLTVHAENYEYVYDPFGRLRKVKNMSTEALVAEYTYSGLGHRIGWHYDVDAGVPDRLAGSASHLRTRSSSYCKVNPRLPVDRCGLKGFAAPWAR